MIRKKQKPEPTRRDVLKWLTTGALTSLLPLSYASYSTGWISVERRELQIPTWDADGFRVALLSDLHIDSQLEAEHAQLAIQMAIAEKPDLIAIPGDFVNKDQHPAYALVTQSLEPLHEAKCPVVATLGNHDYDIKHVSHIADTVRRSAAKLLRNETCEVSGVTVAGIDDGIARRHDTRFLNEGHYSKSLLALFHEPDFVEYVPENVSLQLSGHSHGGQICLPGGIPLHTPVGSETYYEGFYPQAKVPLYVTRGIGTVGPRWRLFCRPEVSILTLRRI